MVNFDDVNELVCVDVRVIFLEKYEFVISSYFKKTDLIQMTIRNTVRGSIS